MQCARFFYIPLVSSLCFVVIASLGLDAQLKWRRCRLDTPWLVFVTLKGYPPLTGSLADFQDQVVVGS